MILKLKQQIVFVILCLLFSISFIGYSQTDKQKELYTAIYTNDFENMKILLSEGANINGPLDTIDVSPLGFAIANSSKIGKEIIIYLIDNGADINQITSGMEGRSPFFLACKYGLLEYVKYMMELKPDVNVRDRFGQTAVYFVSQNGDIEIIELLISQKADLNICSYEGYSPIMIASGYGNKEIVQLLLKNGAKPDNNCSESNPTALYFAAKQGFYDIVKILIQYKANINYTDADGMHPIDLINFEKDNMDILKFMVDNGADYKFKFFLAIGSNDVKSVKKMLKTENVNQTVSEIKLTPLMLACEYGNMEIIQLLIDKGAEVNQIDASGKSAIVYTISSDKLEIARYLIDKGAELNLFYDGISPLIKAIIEEKWEFAELFIEKGANVNAFQTITPMDVTLFKQNYDFADYLIEKGADINLKGDHGNTALYNAAKEGDLESVNFLLNKGAKADIKNSYGYSPLAIASYNGDLQIVNILINKGADINSTDEEGNKPIHHAASGGNLEIVKMLHKRGANINDISKSKHNTPLIYSCKIGNFYIANYLIRNGADVNVQDYQGNTALFFASYGYKITEDDYSENKKMYIEKAKYGESGNALSNSYLDVMISLLEKGADPNISNNLGQIPLHAAINDVNLEGMKILLEKGSKINTKDNNLSTCLTFAIIGNQVNALKLLLEEGADVNARDANGVTALHIAAYKGYYDCVKLLLEYNADPNIEDIQGTKAVQYTTNDEIKNLINSITK